MKAQRAIKTRINREPASAGPFNQGRTRERSVRLRDMPIYLVCLVFAYLALSASPAAATPPDGGGITKVCPDTSIGTTLDALIGRAWGWADTLGTAIVALAVVILIVVAGHKVGREKVIPFVVLTGLLLLLAGVIIVAITGRSGAC